MMILLSGCGGSSKTQTVIDKKQIFSVNISGAGQIIQSQTKTNVGDRLDIDLLPDKGYMVDQASGCNGEWLDNRYVVQSVPEVCELAFVFRQVVRENVDNLFVSMQLETDTYRLNYHLYSPPIKQGERYPLILALHGTAEGAAAQEGQVNPHLVDNIGEVIGRPVATTWVQEPIREQYPAFVLAPLITLDANGQWYDDELTRIFDQAIQSVLDTHPVDPDRIYLVGHSVGGMAAWTAPAILNSRFAAIMPMSGWFDSNNASATLPETIDLAYSTLSIWSFGHVDDIDVPIIATREIRSEMQTQGRSVQVFNDLNLSSDRAAALQALKQPFRYFNTELTQPCFGGGAACHWAGMDNAATEPLLVDWLFRQHRIDPEAIRSTSASAEQNDVVLTWELALEYMSETMTIWVFSEQELQWRKLTSIPAYEQQASIASSALGADTLIRMTLRDTKGMTVGMRDIRL